MTTIADARGRRASERGASAAKCVGGQRRNGLPALDVDDDRSARRPRRRRAPAAPRLRCRLRVDRHFHRRVRRVGGGDAKRCEQIPLVFDRVPRRAARAAARTRRVYIQARPGDVVADPVGAPLSHVSSDARGPPWKSMRGRTLARAAAAPSARSCEQTPPCRVGAARRSPRRDEGWSRRSRRPSGSTM